MLRSALLTGITIFALCGGNAHAALLKKIPHPANRAIWAEWRKESDGRKTVHLTENGGKWFFQISPPWLETMWKVYGDRTAVTASWSPKGSYLIMALLPFPAHPKDMPDLYLYSLEHYGVHVSMPYCQGTCEYGVSPVWTMQSGHLSYKRMDGGKFVRWIHIDLRSGIPFERRDHLPTLKFLEQSLRFGLPLAAKGNPQVMRAGLAPLPPDMRLTVERHLNRWRHNWTKPLTAARFYCDDDTGADELSESDCDEADWYHILSVATPSPSDDEGEQRESLIFTYDLYEDKLTLEIE